MKLVVSQYNSVEINFEYLIREILRAEREISNRFFVFDFFVFRIYSDIGICTCCLVVMQRDSSCAACDGINVVNVVMHWR